MSLLNKFNCYCKGRWLAFKEYTQVSQNTYVIILASFVGILGGLGAVGFRMLINFFQNLVLKGDGNIISILESYPWYIKLFIPLSGAIVVGPLIYFFSTRS